ncbi:MAG: 16S rRNA (uracil(1498)-N(3))-methyltransferase [bacterium]|nr:16S rRNA (uracil(1498)-N(3))-methyltransferase [bacterium]
MHRIYIPPEYVSENEIFFPDEPRHRVRSVLRLNSGDMVIIFDGHGQEYQVVLNQLGKNEIRGTITSKRIINREPKLDITLLQGLPKSEKMELIVQKATELGVSRIIPIITDRTIPRLTAEKANLRVERWQKIAIAAAEQSGRTRIPEIKPPVPFMQGLRNSVSEELRLFFWEEEKENTLKSILKKRRTLNSLALFIGPEGGFTMAEAELAKQAGAQIVSLGSRVLRTETAAIAVLSILLYEFE